MKKKNHFIQKATARMKAKGTLGSFGKATPKKIARAKKLGGKMKKKAIFAQNMRAIARKRAGRKKR
ncbi:MAG TPA: hypothetical protein VN666_21895 [Nitrospira sp.]|nr:hypothetical protein [Nitrospira sp.]